MPKPTREFDARESNLKANEVGTVARPNTNYVAQPTNRLAFPVIVIRKTT
ncbi:MAG TPA: hypothetical protein VG122_23015 [Gemmata sp.]|jgi:hypothetical protein|nr:hypothetical protein [Gemmata sp.]